MGPWVTQMPNALSILSAFWPSSSHSHNIRMLCLCLVSLTSPKPLPLVKILLVDCGFSFTRWLNSKLIVIHIAIWKHITSSVMLVAPAKEMAPGFRFMTLSCLGINGPVFSPTPIECHLTPILTFALMVNLMQQWGLTATHRAATGAMPSTPRWGPLV